MGLNKYVDHPRKATNAYSSCLDDEHVPKLGPKIFPRV